MKTVTSVPKFQIVIPIDIRETLQLNPGQNVHTIMYDDRMVLVPIRPMRQRGFLKDIDTTVIKEKDRM